MSIPGNETCPHCKLPLREYHDFTTCDSCQTSFHDKCWQEGSGCSVCNLVEKTVSTARDKSSSWYLYHKGKNLGPLSWEQLCSQPGIQPDDLVWNGQMPDWIRADQLPNLPLAGRSPSGDPSESKRIAGHVVLPEMKDYPHRETGPVNSFPEPQLPEIEKETPYRQATPEPEEHNWVPGQFTAEEAASRNLDYISSQEPAPNLDEPAEVEQPVVLPETEEHPASETGPVNSFPEPQLPEIEKNPGSFAEQELPPRPFTQHQEQDWDNQMPRMIDNLPDSSVDFISTWQVKQPLGESEELARPYSRHVVYGILLVIGGAAAIALSLIYTLDKSELINLVAWGVIVFGICDLFYGLFGWLKTGPRKP